MATTQTLEFTVSSAEYDRLDAKIKGLSFCVTMLAVSVIILGVAVTSLVWR